VSVLFFLSSGLFLGWSHGANNAGNVFGTAIGSKMVKFRTAAVIAGIFMILGSAISGAGASQTLGRLGSVNEIAGAFMVALAAAVSLLMMTRFNIPVSTSQTIVGSIIGWNFFSGSLTDYESLMKIVSSWLVAPLASAVLAVALYIFFRFLLTRFKIHLLQLDMYTRIGLIAVGAFGSYSLGANNIANVMGVFVPVAPFRPIDIIAGILTSRDQLFILGGMAMAAGVLTYSYKVMKTVGQSIIPLTPITALVAVLSSSTVLFLFSSQDLELLLASHGLPSIPLVPVSSSQAVVGAIIGIGLFQGGREMNFKLLGKIASGWVTAPVMACIISFVSLFIIQNVFSQPVYRDVKYSITSAAAQKLHDEGITFSTMDNLVELEFRNAAEFKYALKRYAPELESGTIMRVIRLSQIHPFTVNDSIVSFEIGQNVFSEGQVMALHTLNGKKYRHVWQFADDLASAGDEWKTKPDIPANRPHNNYIRIRIDYLAGKFSGMR